MIIKRLARTLRERDWPAIVVEVLIVVVGIVLGLQANEWHEERKLRQQESVYLSKIQDDLLAMQAELTGRITLFDTSAQRMISALRALEACDASSDAQEHVKYALEKYQSSPPISYLDAPDFRKFLALDAARLKVAVEKIGKVEDGKLRPLDIKAGERVLFGKYAGTEVKIDGEEHLIPREDDILGVIEK